MNWSKLGKGQAPTAGKKGLLARIMAFGGGRSSSSFGCPDGAPRRRGWLEKQMDKRKKKKAAKGNNPHPNRPTDSYSATGRIPPVVPAPYNGQFGAGGGRPLPTRPPPVRPPRPDQPSQTGRFGAAPAAAGGGRMPPPSVPRPAVPLKYPYQYKDLSAGPSYKGGFIPFYDINRGYQANSDTIRIRYYKVYGKEHERDDDECYNIMITELALWENFRKDVVARLEEFHRVGKDAMLTSFLDRGRYENAVAGVTKILDSVDCAIRYWKEKKRRAEAREGRPAQHWLQKHQGYEPPRPAPAKKVDLKSGIKNTDYSDSHDSFIASFGGLYGLGLAAPDEAESSSAPKLKINPKRQQPQIDGVDSKHQSAVADFVRTDSYQSAVSGDTGGAGGRGGATPAAAAAAAAAKKSNKAEHVEVVPALKTDGLRRDSTVSVVEVGETLQVSRPSSPAVSDVSAGGRRGQGAGRGGRGRGGAGAARGGAPRGGRKGRG